MGNPCFGGLFLYFSPTGAPEAARERATPGAVLAPSEVTIEDNFHEEADPHRNLGYDWAGETLCERNDGSWLQVAHGLRKALFTPTHLEPHTV